MKRFWAVALPFVLIGPPSGAVAAVLTVFLEGLALGPERRGSTVSPASLSEVLASIVQMVGGLLLALPLSYLVGGISALLTGFLCGVWYIGFGVLRWWTPVFISGLIGLAYVLYPLVTMYLHYQGRPYGPSDHAWDVFFRTSLMIFNAHIIAALAGWFFLRSRFWTVSTGLDGNVSGAVRDAAIGNSIRSAE